MCSRFTLNSRSSARFCVVLWVHVHYLFIFSSQHYNQRCPSLSREWRVKRTVCVTWWISLSLAHTLFFFIRCSWRTLKSYKTNMWAIVCSHFVFAPILSPWLGVLILALMTDTIFGQTWWIFFETHFYVPVSLPVLIIGSLRCDFYPFSHGRISLQFYIPAYTQHTRIRNSTLTFNLFYFPFVTHLWVVSSHLCCISERPRLFGKYCHSMWNLVEVESKQKKCVGKWLWGEWHGGEQGRLQ